MKQIEIHFRDGGRMDILTAHPGDALALRAMVQRGESGLWVARVRDGHGFRRIASAHNVNDTIGSAVGHVRAEVYDDAEING